MVPIVRPVRSHIPSAIFATTGLIVPSMVAGMRNVITKCRKMRIGQDSPSRALHCPIQLFTIGMVTQESEARMNRSERVRLG